MSLQFLIASNAGRLDNRQTTQFRSIMRRPLFELPSKAQVDERKCVLYVRDALRTSAIYREGVAMTGL